MLLNSKFVYCSSKLFDCIPDRNVLFFMKKNNNFYLDFEGGPLDLYLYKPDKFSKISYKLYNLYLYIYNSKNKFTQV